MPNTPDTGFKISERHIGSGHPPYIIAEMSGNHLQGLDRALLIMERAKAAGADAVKLQTYTPDTMTIDCEGRGFVIEEGLWKGRKLYDLYQEAHTPWDWHPQLFEKGRELGITVFSTPFDETAVDFLEALDCPAYKIASFEAADLPLIRKVAQTGKPLIISTGMVTPEEIGEMLDAARTSGAKDICLLHCVSAYPAKTEDSNLRTIPVIEKKFGTSVGLSDHTLGTCVAVSAVALGATIIEKHVTLNRAEGGPDADFSLEPPELERLVEDCNASWRALGEVKVGRQNAAEPNLVFRRSLYAAEDIKKGARFTRENIRSIRPGYGLAPKYIDDILDRTAAEDIQRGTPLEWSKIK